MQRIFFIIFAAISLLAASSQVFAQGDKKHPEDRDAFIAKRNAFITADLNLTPEEAAAFIPLCNELQDKLFELWYGFGKKERDLWMKKNPTEDEYNQLLDEMMELKAKETALEKEYYLKFRKVLPAEKVFKYRHSDGKFMRSLMDEKKREKRKQ